MLPLVLHHGFAGTPGLTVGPWRSNYFRGIDRALAAGGRPVIVPRVHPTAGIERRATELKRQIVDGLAAAGRPDDPVVVVAHSMGGLDARHMIRRLDMESRVAALLTVTTPHRGSPFADWCVRNLGRRVPLIRWVERLGWDLGAARDLTTDACRWFNDRTPDSDRVKYFSVSAARPWHLVPAFAYASHAVIRAAEGDNDGLVSVRSSGWGTRLGTWAADHWHTINHKLVVEFRNPTGDIVPYYARAVAAVDAALAA
ncbi:MAG: thioesterase [Phycisphaerales bacterium]|nr:thioesterase [Phycisphaerales bacterium]